ncbi:hypothetical protein WMY93_004896 [Mugilogobius chulae]|uniref:Uncharacterized protein n=1 Tax=Mugilogobius chulae TaxID=88201 RepID=A0AAW0PPQ1_9GOBI
MFPTKRPRGEGGNTSMTDTNMTEQGNVSPTSRSHKSRSLNRTPSQKHEEIRRYGPNLRVQGFGCPLLQRPGSGQPSPQTLPTENRPSPTSLLLPTEDRPSPTSLLLPTEDRPSPTSLLLPTEDRPSPTSLLLLSSIKNKLESRVLPALRSRAAPKPGSFNKSTSSVSPTGASCLLSSLL